MSTVLVTGGAGYIGSHAVLALARAGRRVIVYDDLSAGHRQAVTHAQRASASAGGGAVELVVGAMQETARLADLLAEQEVTAVLHFAAWLSVGDSVKDPAGYYQNNVVGTLSVLTAMQRAQVKRLIFSSTCAVFGEPRETPIAEQHPRHPVNAYGESKLAVERALPHFEQAYDIRWTALRYFNAAGADPGGCLGEDHDPEQHLIPRAIATARGGEPLVVFGDDYPTPDGTCLRDYVHVSDLADAHLRALERLESGGRSGAYNLGNGQPHSVREVIATVEQVTGMPVPARIGPRRAGDPAALYAANGSIQRDMGWQPRFADLHAIVSDAWRWHEAHPHGYEE
ncbi:MAG: UDP-glucose 4-epimerase GalE [Luteitalea sp.]|nr:UDP-glucose 4-epimerase GalE [Luteitalea sp.]